MELREDISEVTEEKASREEREIGRKDLRHLRRLDLLELLLAEREENERLRKEIQDQDMKLQELKSKLEDRKLRISKAGSMSEAALALNHIFEDADAAAKQYLDSLRENTKDCSD